MSRLKTVLTILVTALVTCLFTSLFWIAAYSGGDEDQEDARPRMREASTPPPSTTRPVLGPSGLALPVAGVRPGELIDTFTQARAGGARVHDAIDIMAPDGTGVLAAAPGRVEKLFFSEGGGMTAYVRSDDKRWIYYYAHLRGYAPGLAEGKRVARGALIGFVGSTGNAAAAGPHLHFAIHRMEAGESWHEGTAINPYPLLAGRRSGS